MKKLKHFIVYLIIFIFGVTIGLAAFAFIMLPMVKGVTQNIVGTWFTGSYNESYYDYNKHKWVADWRDYRTVFTADGKIGHYGYRNCDNGTWKWIGINKIKAEFTECYYAPVGEAWYCNADAPSYTCEYVWEDGSLYRTRGGETEFIWKYLDKGFLWDGNGSDLDHYNWPMKKINEDTNLETWWDMFPDTAFFDEAVEQKLLAAAPDLMAGKDVGMELPDAPYEIDTYAACDLTGDGKKELFVLVKLKSMYADGCQEKSMLYILSLQEDERYTILDKNGNLPTNYVSMRVDQGKMVYQCILDGDGTFLTFTFGFEAGRVVVEKHEAVYGVNGTRYTYLLYESYDLKNGIFTAYTALDRIERTKHFYAADEMILESKVFEEKFQEHIISFSEFDIVGLFAPGEKRIVPMNHLVYDVLAKDVRNMRTWWKHHNDGEEAPLWILKAANENPEKLLDQAAERYEYAFEKTWIPWSEETKENMEKLMKCPMPDYYYQSKYYALIYAEGEVRLYRKNYDNRGEKFTWILDEVYK